MIFAFVWLDKWAVMEKEEQFLKCESFLLRDSPNGECVPKELEKHKSKQQIFISWENREEEVGSFTCRASFQLSLRIAAQVLL